MPDCKSCKTERKQVADVPYIVHESDMARLERTIKRLWILLLVVIVLLVGSNIGWMVYENQFEEVTTTESYEATTDDGGTAIANGSGEVRYYGAGEVHENDNDP